MKNFDLITIMYNFFGWEAKNTVDAVGIVLLLATMAYFYFIMKLIRVIDGNPWRK